MKTLVSVRELMSFIEDGESKWVTLITACSDEEVYSNWYFCFPYEMKEPDVTSIRLEKDQIVLYIL